MARFVLSLEARDDLREIRDYMARDNVDAARRVLRKLRDAMGQLSDDLTPGIWRHRCESLRLGGPTGTMYQLEVESFWDGDPQRVIRVMGSVDDGGWRAFCPLTDSFLVSPDGSFVDED